jgi:hypothetical protein
MVRRVEVQEFAAAGRSARRGGVRVLLAPLGRLCSTRLLEERIERTLADAADLAGEVSQALDFIFAEVTTEDTSHEDVGNLTC